MGTVRERHAARGYRKTVPVKASQGRDPSISINSKKRTVSVELVDDDA